MSENKFRVGVLGAGRWANMAHIPGWLRDPRVEVVALCDVELPLARKMADSFNLPEATDDWQTLVSREDVDIIDIVTPSNTPHELATAAPIDPADRCGIPTAAAALLLADQAERRRTGNTAHAGRGVQPRHQIQDIEAGGQRAPQWGVQVLDIRQSKQAGGIGNVQRRTVR